MPEYLTLILLTCWNLAILTQREFEASGFVARVELATPRAVRFSKKVLASEMTSDIEKELMIGSQIWLIRDDKYVHAAVFVGKSKYLWKEGSTTVYGLGTFKELSIIFQPDAVRLRTHVLECDNVNCERSSAEMKLSRCAACKSVAYCCVECQTLDWKETHSEECKDMSDDHKWILHSIHIPIVAELLDKCNNDLQKELEQSSSSSTTMKQKAEIDKSTGRVFLTY